jgi:hypothetical protein
MLQCISGTFVSFSGSQDKPKGQPQLVKPERIQGCYELTLSPWRPDLNLGEDAVFITPPHRIQLLTERGTEGWEQEGFIAKPAPGVKASVHRGSWWLPKSSDSIGIWWTTGYSGLRMVLKIDGTDLRGKATSFWDFPRKRQTADVTAHKVDCEKPSAGT